MPAAADPHTEAIVRKITRHLMPVLGVMYLIAYIDRQNISYAKLQMVGDLGLTETTYGLGASLFFIGYFLFEVPSNVILARVGARRLVRPHHGQLGSRHPRSRAYPERGDVLRPALPAGRSRGRVFPGRPVCTDALGSRRTTAAGMVGMFMGASAVANAVGAAIGGSLLDVDGLMGLRGWQWVFLVTALPAIVLAS